MDNEDCIKLRELAETHSETSQLLTDCLKKAQDLELELDLGIIKHDISDTVTWKKQVLKLIKKEKMFAVIYSKFMKNKADIKICQTVLKTIETEINIIKKTIEVTP